MQTAATRNLVLTEFSSIVVLAGSQMPSSQGEVYQQFLYELIKGVYNKNPVPRLANNLIDLADHAYQLRQMEQVGEISQLLSALPHYESVSDYYRALYIKKQGNIAEARQLLERVADDAPLRFRARAIMSLGTTFFEQGDFHQALPFYVEAGKAAKYLKHLDPITTVVLQQAHPILHSLDGNHTDSLSYLEGMIPLVRAVALKHPFFWYQLLNSISIELVEVGRLEEATNVCKIVLASPFVFAYPEWRETGQELALRGYKSRSVVSVPELPLKSNNVVPIPVNNNPSLSQEECAEVLDLQAWREKMVKEPNGEDENLDEMDFNELIVKLLQLTTHEELSEKKLRKVVKSAIKIIEEKD